MYLMKGKNTFAHVMSVISNSNLIIVDMHCNLQDCSVGSDLTMRNELSITDTFRHNWH